MVALSTPKLRNPCRYETKWLIHPNLPCLRMVIILTKVTYNPPQSTPMMVCDV